MWVSSTDTACFDTARKSCICAGEIAWLSAYAVGTVPIKINMIRPMPFWPSFDPCAKLTPVQVRISNARIQNGGGVAPRGSPYSWRLVSTRLETSSRIAAQMNPTSGDNSSERPTPAACAQSTPLVAVRFDISSFAIPTPMIDPISVCELEEGNPKYQVPRFQMMAATSSANTIANPVFDPTCRISSTGSSATMPNATAPEDTSTPRKFQNPDQTTAT